MLTPKERKQFNDFKKENNDNQNLGWWEKREIAIKSKYPEFVYKRNVEGLIGLDIEGTIQKLFKRIEEFEGISQKDNFSALQIFRKQLELADGINWKLGTITGSQFGTATTQKIGFLGKTPVVRQATITAPSGGGSGSDDAIDISARTAINEIKALLTLFGFTA